MRDSPDQTKNDTSTSDLQSCELLRGHMQSKPRQFSCSLRSYEFRYFQIMEGLEAGLTGRHVPPVVMTPFSGIVLVFIPQTLLREQNVSGAMNRVYLALSQNAQVKTCNYSSTPWYGYYVFL